MKNTLKGVLCNPFMFLKFVFDFKKCFSSILFIQHIMEFKQEELVEREIEIAGYLLQNFSLKMIGEKTGLSKKLLAAHLQNMMKKLKAEDMEALIKLIKKI